MEIHHKVKPIHGWREFFGEVGIIVLGVLVALGAEQFVEWVHWHHQTTLAEEALTDDFADLVWLSRERGWRSYCIGHQLDEVATVLGQAEINGRLPPVGTFGTVPARRAWNVDSWEALVASNAIGHLPREKQIGYGGVVHFTSEINNAAREEFEDWTQLATMVGPGRRLSDTEAAMLQRARSAAAFHARVLRNTTLQLQGFIKDSGLVVDGKLAEIVRERGSWTHGQAQHACAPMGPVPKTYTYSMFYSVPMDGSVQ